MKGYRDPARQARRWEAQADAWRCPNRCGHDVTAHREYPSTWERGEDGPVEVRHPRYLPGRFACQLDGCDCEFGDPPA
jgi:hypothetical protein